MSNSFKSKNEINIYEINGKEIIGIGTPTLMITNHWNRKNLVNIRFEGTELTVSADDLKRSIENAQNAHKL